MRIPLPLRTLPLLYLCLLAGLAYLLDFNGLYGQDAYEYVRQCRVFADRLQGLPTPPPGIGESELGGGYPLLGAVLTLLGPDALTVLRWMNLIAVAVALWQFEQILRILSPGARAESRWVFGFAALALAPAFTRAGLTVMSDALALVFSLTALFYGLRALEQQRSRDAVGFALWAAFAVSTRYAMAALLALPALALLFELRRERQWGWLMAALTTGLVALLPLWWLKYNIPKSLIEHSLLSDWTLVHLFQRSFLQASGTVSYTLPNLAYLLFPLAHPGFCLTLPGLLLLARRTDVRLYSKRLLGLSLLVYLLFLGGFPHQSLRFLLPAFAVLLLLLFPAWDRFYAYGLYFFKRLTYALIGLTLLCQLVFSVVMLAPVIRRNHVEQQAANVLSETLRDGDVLYSLDLDIALQYYLPALEYRNLWLQRYDSFPPGSYILFNAPALEKQWANQPPMQNWEYAREHNLMEEIRRLPEGWTLYRVIK